VDRRTTVGLRVNGKAASYEFQTLLHAVETKPTGLPCLCDIKAQTAISDREMNLIRGGPQLSIELSRPAMLDRVVQGFL
jgi:hypothetical protein